MAETIMRRLEVPLSALSPLRLQRSAAAAEPGEARLQLVSRTPEREQEGVCIGGYQLVASEGSGGELDEDDRPLCQLFPPADERAASPLQDRNESALVPFESPEPASAGRAGHSPLPLPAWPEPPTPSHNRSPLEGGSELLAASVPDLDTFEYPGSQAALQRGRPRRALRASKSAPPVPNKSRTAGTAAAASAASKQPSGKHRCLAASTSEPLPLPAAAAGKAVPQPMAAAPRRRLAGPGQLVLLLDHREIGAGREHSARGALIADLQQKLGASSVEGRSLPLGDVLWIWRGEGPEAQEELVAGWIVERKTFNDLSGSIMDGRYEEQKSRLLEAPGLEGVIYLVEGHGPLFGVSEAHGPEAKNGSPKSRGFGQRLLNHMLPAASLSTSAVHTQLISGFHVIHSASTPHTVALLVALHGSLAEQQLGDSGQCLVPYADFAERTKKSCHSRVFEAFGRMLRVVPSCGPEATEALVDEFQTPHSFAAALRDMSDTDLLLRLRARKGGGGRTPVTSTALAACRALFGA